MIGHINHQQSTFVQGKPSVPCMNENRQLKNAITGSIIKVKNINSDFRIISKELSLANEVKHNAQLSSISCISSYRDQESRFSSLGMAVSTIYNIGFAGEAKEKASEICERHIRNNPGNINSDIAMTNRGLEFINSYLTTTTSIDATNYAIALRVGTDIKQNILDPIMINNFNSTWQMRIDLSEKINT